MVNKMLKADEVKKISDETADNILKNRKEGYIIALDQIKEDIFRRILEAANRPDKAVYSITLSNTEICIIENTDLFQSLGYKIIANNKAPWGGIISWE